MRIFRFDPHTRLYFLMLQACRKSLADGHISFFGTNVDRQTRPLRFWTEWFVQAAMLAMPLVALFGFVGLIFWTNP